MTLLIPQHIVSPALIDFAELKIHSTSLPYLVHIFCGCYAHLQQLSPGHHQQHVCAFSLSMGRLLQGHQILKRLRSAESEFGATGANFPLCINIYKLILLGAGLG